MALKPKEQKNLERNISYVVCTMGFICKIEKSPQDDQTFNAYLDKFNSLINIANKYKIPTKEWYEIMQGN